MKDSHEPAHAEDGKGSPSMQCTDKPSDPLRYFNTLAMPRKKCAAIDLADIRFCPGVFSTFSSTLRALLGDAEGTVIQCRVRKKNELDVVGRPETQLGFAGFEPILEPTRDP